MSGNKGLTNFGLYPRFICPLVGTVVATIISVRRKAENETDKQEENRKMKCQCEANRQHHPHVGSCKAEATVSVKTIYGTYEMCQSCAESFPIVYLKK